VSWVLGVAAAWLGEGEVESPPQTALSPLLPSDVRRRRCHYCCCCWLQWRRSLLVPCSLWHLCDCSCCATRVEFQRESHSRKAGREQ
jgi:hypothetical protein